MFAKERRRYACLKKERSNAILLSRQPQSLRSQEVSEWLSPRASRCTAPNTSRRTDHSRGYTTLHFPCNRGITKHRSQGADLVEATRVVTRKRWQDRLRALEDGSVGAGSASGDCLPDNATPVAQTKLRWSIANDSTVNGALSGTAGAAWRGGRSTSRS